VKETVSKSGVQVLDRTCDILEYLANHGPELGLSEITDDLGLSKSTVHRLLSALERRAYVRRFPLTSKYGLGTKLVELGFKASNGDGLVTQAGRYLTRLVAETGETVHLGVLRGGVVVTLSQSRVPRRCVPLLLLAAEPPPTLHR
jgi:DNA-binding IclR family transcriptional regulator